MRDAFAISCATPAGRVFVGLTLTLSLVPAIAAPVAVEPAYDRYARPGQMVRLPDGRRLNLRCGGRGRVTVLLESGLGFPSYSWRKVQPALERVTRTCSYDRAGLGFSDPGPLPRSAGAIADDLRALVRTAGLRPPFLLVANSLGSQPARLFAFRQPSDVAGMVLVDPTWRGRTARSRQSRRPRRNKRSATPRRAAKCLRLLLAHALTPDEALRRECIDGPDPAFSPMLTAVVQRQRMGAAMARASASELEALETLSERQIAGETRPLGAMPILVLSAGKDFDGNPREAELMAELRRLHATLAALSTRGEERLVPGAGHVIQSSDPPAVIAAVRELLTR